MLVEPAIERDYISKAKHEAALREAKKEARAAALLEAQQGITAGKPGPDTARKDVTGGSRTIQTMDDADRRYNLPAGHPERIEHDAYKEARERLGVKSR